MEKKAKNFDKIVAEWKSKIDSLQASSTFQMLCLWLGMILLKCIRDAVADTCGAISLVCIVDADTIPKKAVRS